MNDFASVVWVVLTPARSWLRAQAKEYVAEGAVSRDFTAEGKVNTSGRGDVSTKAWSTMLKLTTERLDKLQDSVDLLRHAYLKDAVDALKKASDFENEESRYLLQALDSADMGLNRLDHAEGSLVIAAMAVRFTCIVRLKDAKATRCMILADLKALRHNAHLCKELHDAFKSRTQLFTNSKKTQLLARVFDMFLALSEIRQRWIELGQEPTNPDEYDLPFLEIGPQRGQQFAGSWAVLYPFGSTLGFPIGQVARELFLKRVRSMVTDKAPVFVNGGFQCSVRSSSGFFFGAGKLSLSETLQWEERRQKFLLDTLFTWQA